MGAKVRSWIFVSCLLLVSLPGYGAISLFGAVGMVIPGATAVHCGEVPAVRKEARLRDGL